MIRYVNDDVRNYEATHLVPNVEPKLDRDLLRLERDSSTYFGNLLWKPPTSDRAIIADNKEKYIRKAQHLLNGSLNCVPSHNKQPGYLHHMVNICQLSFDTLGIDKFVGLWISSCCNPNAWKRQLLMSQRVSYKVA